MINEFSQKSKVSLPVYPPKPVSFDRIFQLPGLDRVDQKYYDWKIS